MNLKKKRIPPPVIPQPEPVNIRSFQKQKPVATIDFDCPCGCKKSYVLTLDKKIVKSLLQDIKNGGVKIPRGTMTAPVIRKIPKVKKH